MSSRSALRARGVHSNGHGAGARSTVSVWNDTAHVVVPTWVTLKVR